MRPLRAVYIHLFWLLAMAFYWAVAQGPLSPSSAPAPSMKTLEEVEPRTLIATIPYEIVTSGSYYVSANLSGSTGTNGVTISANDVTLDLNGFTLTGGTGTIHGILIDGARQRITIRNGSIRNWGHTGLRANQAKHCRFEHLVVSSNGYESGGGGYGIWCGNVATIRSCDVIQNQEFGIRGDFFVSIFDSVASENGSDGIHIAGNSRVVQSESRFNGGAGIGTTSSSGTLLIDHCVLAGNAGRGAWLLVRGVINHTAANDNGDYGFAAWRPATVTGCTAYDNVNGGFDFRGENTVRNCTASSNQGPGFNSSDADTFFMCQSSKNQGAGFIIGTGSSISRCTAFENVGPGIQATSSCRIENNNCEANGALAGNAAGIHVTGAECVVRNNRVGNNDRGIDVDGTRNL
ncbi:MAG: right-handed parallel beta-helix repeat-containing protein, partial [Verrucomicrobiota bacterium]